MKPVHIDVKFQFPIDIKRDGEMDLVYSRSENQVASIFTRTQAGDISEVERDTRSLHNSKVRIYINIRNISSREGLLDKTIILHCLLANRNYDLPSLYKKVQIFM